MVPGHISPNLRRAITATSIKISSCMMQASMVLGQLSPNNQWSHCPKTLHMQLIKLRLLRYTPKKEEAIVYDYWVLVFCANKAMQS